MINIKMKNSDPVNCVITDQEGVTKCVVTIHPRIELKVYAQATLTFDVNELDLVGIDIELPKKNKFKPVHEETGAFGDFSCCCAIDKNDCAILIKKIHPNKPHTDGFKSVFGKYIKIAGQDVYHKVLSIRDDSTTKKTICYMVFLEEKVGAEFSRGQVVGFYEKA